MLPGDEIALARGAGDVDNVHQGRGISLRVGFGDEHRLPAGLRQIAGEECANDDDENQEGETPESDARGARGRLLRAGMQPLFELPRFRREVETLWCQA